MIPVDDVLELLADLLAGHGRLLDDMVDRIAARITPEMTAAEIEAEMKLETQRAGVELDDLLAASRAELARRSVDD